MPTNISWKLNVEVQAGPKVNEAKIIQVDAFDRIEVSVPDTTSSPAETEIDIQPGGPGNIQLLLIRSSAYGNNLKYKVHNTTTTERVLNDAIFLTGKGSLDLLEGGITALDKLLVTNTTGNSVVLEIIVGRTAV